MIYSVEGFYQAGHEPHSIRDGADCIPERELRGKIRESGPVQKEGDSMQLTQGKRTRFNA